MSVAGRRGMSAATPTPVAREAWFEREGIALLTDFYELTMMARPSFK